MIQFSLQQVALVAVDFEDTTFLISANRKPHQLAQSIARLGLLQEPFLREHSGCLQIVSGFRRLEACRQLNWQTLPAKILPSSTGIIDVTRLSIIENVSQRPLNLVEQARCLGLLSEHCASDKSALARELSRLNLDAWWGMRTKLLAADQLHPELKTALQEDIIGLAVALDLGKWNPKAALQMVQIFKKLPMGLNRQREMLTLVKEIALREARDKQGICEELQKECSQLPLEADRRAQVREIQAKLFARRFPRIVKAQKEFEAKIQKLDFGPGIWVIPPANFEARDYRLEIRFQSRDQLGKRLRRLQSATTHPDLENLLP
jgi:hypothetical protein